MKCQCCDSEPCLEALDNALCCIYCEQPVPQARYEAGYPYCMSKDCVSKGISQARSGYRLILMPKQGFTYVSVDSPDLLNGKSSGR